MSNKTEKSMVERRPRSMVERRTWSEFRDNGFLWFVNQILHVFGWAIVVEIEDDEIINVYPARVKFRGFSEESQTIGYRNISEYLKDSVDEILSEVYGDE